MKLIDLTGQKFGRLTVIERAPDSFTPKGLRVVMWRCRCDCGNEKNVSSACLRNKTTKSCGCHKREKQSKRQLNNRKHNRYDLSGDFGIGYDSNDKEFYFDLEDYDLIKDYTWIVYGKGYVITHIPNEGTVRMHRFIFKDIIKPYPENLVDHINHNLADNRRCNLRITTPSENGSNISISKRNTSGVTGVYYEKAPQKWVASIRKNRKLITLGKFDEFDDAVKARKEAEEIYFGKYSYDNSMLIAEQNGFIEDKV